MDETVEAPRVMRSEKVALTEIAGCHEGEQPGFFLVREEFARKNCNLDAFERRQLEVSDEARRANDALMRKFPNSSRRYLVQEQLPICKVAWLLGYKEVGAFSHAFRRWTGKSPSEVANGRERK